MDSGKKLVDTNPHLTLYILIALAIESDVESPNRNAISVQ